MVHANTNGKDGQKDYSTFSNDVMYDGHMVGAHLRAIRTLVAKIQVDIHDYVPMPVKEDVGSASLLLESASDRLDLILAALDDSCYQYTLTTAQAA